MAGPGRPGPGKASPGQPGLAQAGHFFARAGAVYYAVQGGSNF